jgi:hypothetical protein
VFNHVLRAAPVREISGRTPELARFLNSPDGKAVLMRQCPKMIVIRWIYLYDMDNPKHVNAALSIHDMPLIPRDYRLPYENLTLLSLFAHAMEVVPECSAK